MTNRRVAIIGAGITGLSAALWLEDHSDVTYTVYEANDRVGGKVVTYSSEDLVVEGGADSYLERKESMTHFIERVGLKSELVRNEVGQAYILKDGELHPNPKRTVLGIPTDLEEFLNTELLSKQGKEEVQNEYTKPAYNRGDKDVSLGHFFEYRFGKEMVQSLIEPLLGGIYGGNVYEMSMEATFPHFLEYEKEKGSILRAVEKDPSKNPAVAKQGMFLTVTSGLQTVLEAAVKQLKENTVLLNEQVNNISRLNDNSYQVKTISGHTETYDDVLITLTPKKAAMLLNNNRLNQAAENMISTSCATVALVFPEGSIKNNYEGTGFVVARGGKETITACTWTDVKWPHTSKGNQTLLRAYVGRPDDSAIVDRADKDIVKAVLQDLKQVMSFVDGPSSYKVTRWKEAMPQYKVGHVERLTRLREVLIEEFPHLYMAGAGFEGVGLPDCVNQGVAYAKKIAKKTT
ncbi:oxygen-dependent protoporphyrinogen oxidase [Alkalihalobacillus xiaoxiensis]|uniref:Coproporphyrinogen III oxidase n=1 Tax=Shouchella xiaoxiensis TaxID=766895 RepID=A0ABS2SR39_9BACI|nr:protoporphyrinogen oxidase [Shouchella xiaoxiensis]MBM7837977.1 oxygen-dependent protoporphyrinogen oxidase [Shouchella xiaoxiensis]